MKQSIPADRGRVVSCLLLLVLALTGCRKDEVVVYQTPKEPAPVPTAAATPHGTADVPQIQWQKPAPWQEQPAGGMRFASFLVPGDGGQQGSVSVVPLGGVVGKELDIVNIFREGGKLPPLTDAELTQVSSRVTFGALEGKLFDMASPEAGESRLLVAVLNQGEAAWYFRFSGPGALVEKEKAGFLEFLNSVKLGEAVASALPAGHPPGSPPATAAADSKAGKPEWTVPAGWQEAPPTQMVLARFQVSADDGKAEITVSTFPGDVGGLVANVNRWRGQIGLGPINQAEVDKLVTSLDASGSKAMLVDMIGQKDNRKIRLVGAIVPRAGRTWFYKLLGDEAAAGREKKALTRFVQSVRYP